MINRKRILAFCLSFSMIFQAAVPVIPVSAAEIQEMSTEEYAEEGAEEEKNDASDENEDADINETDSKSGTDDDAVSDEGPESDTVSEPMDNSEKGETGTLSETETEMDESEIESVNEDERENESEVMSSDDEEFEDTDEDLDDAIYETSEVETETEEERATISLISGEDDKGTENESENMEYSITYVLNGGTNDPLNPESYTHNDENVTKIEILKPTKEKNIFCGWFTDSEFNNEFTGLDTSFFGDITLYAKWEVDGPSIEFKYDLDGGTNSELNPKIEAAEIGKINYFDIYKPEKEGYVFLGWYTNKSTSGSYSGKLQIIDKTEKKSRFTFAQSIYEKRTVVTLYAKWVPLTYTIRISGLSSSYKTYGNIEYFQEFTLPSSARNGYYVMYNVKDEEFIEGSSVSRLTDIQGDIVNIDASYYPITYNLKYDFNGGTESDKLPDSWTVEKSNYFPEPEKKGYIFTGWEVVNTGHHIYSLYDLTSIVNFKGGFNRPTANVSLKANWTPISYRINLVDPENRIQSKTLNMCYDNTDYFGEKDYILNGYKLIKWSDKKAGDGGTEYEAGSEILNLTDIDGQVFTFYARWEAQTYNITYELEGGTNNSNAPMQYTTGKGTGTIPKPTKTGYKFKGWYKDEQHQEQITKIQQDSFNDITLYAAWQPNTFNVTFSPNGSSATGSIDAIAMTYDQEYILPQNTFERPGYTFAGWNTSSTGKGDSYVPEQKVKNMSERSNVNVVLYCMWTPNTNKIIYELYGGTNNESNKETYLTGNLTYLYKPTKTGYIFDGWYTDAEYQNVISSISTSSWGDITLYAKWNPITYSISFNKNASGATGEMEKISATYGVDVTVPGCSYTYPGHRFVGWNTSANGSGTMYKPDDKAKNLTGTNGRTVTLYAQWKSNDYEITYMLDGGTNNSKNPATYKGGSNIKLYSAVKDGYVFDGWYTDPEFTNKITVISKVNDDITVYAKWKDIEFNVVYNANGGTGKMAKTSNVTVKTLKLSKNAYARKGYTFAGWNTSKKGDGIAFSDEQSTFNEFPTVKNKGTVTLYAQWYAPTYNISYELNGGVNDSANPETYNVAKDVTLKNPTRSGYTFAGWYTDPSFKTKVTKVAKTTGSDITLYAKWQANAFTVKFNTNGGKGKMSSVKGTAPESLTLPQNTFTRAGYTFAGWNTDKKGNGTAYTDGDTIELPNAKNGSTLTLYAQWYTPTYTITYELDGGENNTANPETYNVLKDVSLKNPTKPGYTFLGWYKDASYKTKVTKVTKTTGSDITLYAKWQANAFTVKFNTNGGKGKMSSVKGTAPELLILPQNTFTRAGYTFAGWNTDKKGNGTAYTDGDTIELPNAKNGSTLTLYAQWYTPTYTITYELDGGENNTANPETYNVLKDVSLKKPTKPGYTFLGWYKDTAYKTKITKIAKTTGSDITIYAKWQVNSFTVKFNANGGKGKMTSVKGTAPELLTLPANTFTRSGYVFTGWNTNKKGTGTSYSDEEAADFINVKNKSTITLYAQWEKAQ